MNGTLDTKKYNVDIPLEKEIASKRNLEAKGKSLVEFRYEKSAKYSHFV